MGWDCHELAEATTDLHQVAELQGALLPFMRAEQIAPQLCLTTLFPKLALPSCDLQCRWWTQWWRAQHALPGWQR